MRWLNKQNLRKLREQFPELGWMPILEWILAGPTAVYEHSAWMAVWGTISSYVVSTLVVSAIWSNFESLGLASGSLFVLVAWLVFAFAYRVILLIAIYAIKGFWSNIVSNIKNTWENLPEDSDKAKKGIPFAAPGYWVFVIIGVLLQILGMLYWGATGFYANMRSTWEIILIATLVGSIFPAYVGAIIWRLNSNYRQQIKAVDENIRLTGETQDSELHIDEYVTNEEEQKSSYM